jgi:hypothetical protein
VVRAHWRLDFKFGISASNSRRLAIDGVGWMTYVVPPFANHIFLLIAVASGTTEIPPQLWLIIMGVNPERWRQQASAAGVTLNAL